MSPARAPPWEKKRPQKPAMRLTAEQKAAARRRAEQAGRRYPNLVDNMWAAKQPKS